MAEVSKVKESEDTSLPTNMIFEKLKANCVANRKHLA